MQNTPRLARHGEVPSAAAAAWNKVGVPVDLRRKRSRCRIVVVDVCAVEERSRLAPVPTSVAIQVNYS
jgi:hypothetical protein